MTRISTRIFVIRFHSIHHMCHRIFHVEHMFITLNITEKKKASKAFLNFEGVDSCFYVWVNGAYAGYSQVPHATSEFDVTDLLNEGKIH